MTRPVLVYLAAPSAACCATCDAWCVGSKRGELWCRRLEATLPPGQLRACVCGAYRPELYETFAVELRQRLEAG